MDHARTKTMQKPRYSDWSESENESEKESESENEDYDDDPLKYGIPADPDRAFYLEPLIPNKEGWDAAECGVCGADSSFVATVDNGFRGEEGFGCYECGRALCYKDTCSRKLFADHERCSKCKCACGEDQHPSRPDHPQCKCSCKGKGHKTPEEDKTSCLCDCVSTCEGGCGCVCECNSVPHDFKAPQLDDDGTQAVVCAICTQQYVKDSDLLEFALQKWGRTKAKAIQMFYKAKEDERQKKVLEKNKNKKRAHSDSEDDSSPAAKKARTQDSDSD